MTPQCCVGTVFIYTNAVMFSVRQDARDTGYAGDAELPLGTGDNEQ